MTQPIYACLLAGGLLASLVNAQDSYATPSKLPLKRVVLFKNGVGYFEHVGPVHGNESVTIAFTSGQLNDVLKSLTVLDLNGGRIAGVAYGTAAPVDRQLGDLRLPIGEKATLADFLGGLRGRKIEVRNGTSVVTGRLLSVERKTRISGGTTLEVDYLSLISDSGELRTTEISPSFCVRLLEPRLAGRVDRYLDLVSAGREADVRRMVISTEGSDDRSLYVSYISEVPVWKSTYRIVLNSKPGQSPLLQGWAIIDNVVGEDWNSVELSLWPAPRGATVKAFDANGNLVAQASANDAGGYEIPSLPDGLIRLQVESPGFSTTGMTGIMASAGNPIQQDVQLQVGSTTSTVNVVAAAPAMQTDTTEVSSTAMARNAGSGRALGRGVALGSTGRPPGAGYGSGSGGGMGGGAYRVDEARAAAEAAARSQALGDLFEYKLKDPITILKNRSALVPIAQAPITVEKVSLWNDQAGLLRPQRALWITNSTGLTLDGGSVSVLEENTFAGEGVFDPIRPGEKRLFSYAIDLAVNASSRTGTEQERVSRVRIDRGTMTQESEIREKKTYTFRNEDSASHTIIVEHPVRRGYVLRGDARPAETTAAWMRFQL